MRLLIFILPLLAYSEILMFEQGSSTFDDYTPCFRMSNQGLEVWMTTNQPSENERFRTIEVYKVDNGKFILDRKTSSVFIRKDKDDFNYEVYDGSPNFAREVCDNRDGLFVSNRLYKGDNRENDIYQIKYDGSNWQIEYPQKINSDHWDDTPAFSPDGTFMIFSSDRHNPGTGKADLFYSEFKDGEWNYPVPLNEINTDEFSEESPYIDQNNKLYFSSNSSGDYDIYIVDIRSDGKIKGGIQKLDIEGVNQEGTNERNPTISPGNGWFMFASDRGSKGNDDIYYTKMNDDQINIDIQVLLMTRNYADFGSVIEDESVSLQTVVEAKDLNTGEVLKIESNEEGICNLSIPRRAKDKLEYDTGIRKIVISALKPENNIYGELIPAIDTLVFNTWDEVNVRHNLYLWDTSSYYNPECTYEFPVKNVRFFVNAYWCPTTYAYKNFTPCTSMFINESCKIPPEAPCESNEIYNYDLSYEIKNNKTYENCIDYNDFNRNGDRYATEVDAAIDKLKNEMASVFKVPCVQRAINENKQIEVEVIGFTDPNPLFKKCHYIGDQIILLDSNIVIEDREYPIIFRDKNRKEYKDSLIPNMMRFRDTDFGGNQLLSDLRGIYTSILLDKIWYREIPAYKELKDQNLLLVKTWGEAINQDDLEDAQKRSVQVRVTVPTLEPEEIKGMEPKAGGIVELNYTGCK